MLSNSETFLRELPAVVLFILGIGGVAGAILAVVKLWREFVPDGESHMARDIATIKTDIHEVRKRVGCLEIELAKIDQPAIARRFDTLEAKIDKLYEFLMGQFAKGS